MSASSAENKKSLYRTVKGLTKDRQSCGWYNQCLVIWKKLSRTGSWQVSWLARSFAPRLPDFSVAAFPLRRAWCIQ